MHSRVWHIGRWFGFLAIGCVVAVGAGSRFRRSASVDAEIAAERPRSGAMQVAAEAPRPWMAPDPAWDRASPPELAATLDDPVPFPTEIAVAPPTPAMGDDAERAIDELVEAFAGFDPQNVRVQPVADGRSTRFVFTCDIPTSRGGASFTGEGPDPESAARAALSRIRAWAAAPSETTLR